VLRPTFYKVTDYAIITTIYEGDDEHDYGPDILLYDYQRKAVHVLNSQDAAVRVFRDASPDAACPPGMEGVGVRVF
jgi:hypothetical protein